MTVLILPTAIRDSNDALRDLKKGADGLNIYLNEVEIQAFELYLQELKIWNRKINLIGRKDDREIIIKDFLDSLTISKYLPQNASLLDIGSGAGFPGIPLKIARKDLCVFLMEIRNKRVSFLRHVVRLLGLYDVKVSSTEIDPAEHDFDFVIARAFGSLRKLMEIGESYLRKGGTLLSMKGKKGEEELEEEFPFLEKRGWMISSLDKVQLPILGHNRLIIGLERVQKDEI